RQLRTIKLRDRGLLGEWLLVLGQPRRVEHEVLPCFDLRCDVGELKLDALKVRYRLAELLAKRCVTERLLECAFSDAERERGNPNAPGIEGAHEVVESFALFAEQILL